MSLARWRLQDWDPFREIVRLRDEMDRLFGSTLLRRGDFGDFVFAPAVDVYTDKDAIKVKAELPGVKKEDIEVSVLDNVLTVRGSKKEDREIKEEDYHLSERAFGEFERRIELPVKVDAAKVEAKFKDGVLEITLPYHEEVKPKQIEVKVQ